MTTRQVTLRKPEDIIAAVPQLLGFHPHDSLVLMKFRSPGDEQAPTARIDMPHSLDAWVEVYQVFQPLQPYYNDGRAAIVMFTDDAEASLHTLHSLLVMFPNVTWIEALRVFEGRYWTADDAFTGPGMPYVAIDPGFGRDPAIGREERARRFAGEPTEAFERELDRHANRIMSLNDFRAEAERLRDVWAKPHTLTDDELGHTCATVFHPGMRDVVLASITREHLPMLEDAARRCGPNEHILAFAALAAWLAGDGALAWIAYDRVTALNPDNEAAKVVATALTDAIPPSVWQLSPVESLDIFKS